MSLAAALSVATAVLVGAGCSSELEAASDTRQSEDRPTTTSTTVALPPGFPPTTPTFETVPTTSTTTAATVPTIPPPESTAVPDTRSLQACADRAAAYSEVIALAYGGDPDDRLDGLFDRLERNAPAPTRDALDVVRRIIDRTEGDDPVRITAALLSDEFTLANEVIVTWLSQRCVG